MPTKPKKPVVTTTTDLDLILATIKEALVANKTYEKTEASAVVAAAADKAQEVANVASAKARVVADTASELAEITAQTAVRAARAAAELVSEAAVAASKTLTAELVKHTDLDDKRFTDLATLNQQIAVDVKSLLTTRTVTISVGKILGWLGGTIATIAGLILAYLTTKGP